MKQGKINVAFGKVCDMYRIKDLPFTLSRQLFMLKKMLEPFVEHYYEQEYDFLTERDALNPDGTTRTDMPPEEVADINKRLRDMRQSEIDWKEEPVKILLDADLTKKLGVTGELMDQLDGIICFEGVEE